MWNYITSRLHKRRYWRQLRAVHRLEYARDQLSVEGYHSQWGQDKWLAETLLPGQMHGVFAEIGAYDGVTFSNTLYLEQKLGWTGIAVEPIPEVFDTLKRSRQCITVNGCVGAISGTARFRRFTGRPEMLSGLASEYDSRHLQRIDNELQDDAGDCQEIEVQCYSLNDLVRKHKLDHIDYLSLDVEGAEHAVLSAFDFRLCNISIIGVENNYNDFRIAELLSKRGFALHSVVGDEFYISGLSRGGR